MEIEEEEKNNNKKTIELDEILSMTEESLKEFVELSSSFQEFEIIVHYYHEPYSSFQKIKRILSQTSTIIALTLEMDCIKNFDSELTLGQLSELNQLTQLKLGFSKSFFFHISDQLSFGDHLSGFTNLTTFALKLSNSFIIEQNYFSLLSFYQKARNLKKLEFNFSEKDILNNIQELLIGIHFLQELESFKLHLKYLHNQQFIETLSAEILQLKQLKRLDLTCGYADVNQQRDLLRLGRLLNQMSTLESLTINRDIYYSSKPTKVLGCGLEEYFLELPQLKYLELKLSDYSNNLISVLDALSQMKNIDTIILHFSLKTGIFGFQDEVNEMKGAHFSSIPSLKKLSFHFSVTFDYLLVFISELKPLKNLTELVLNCSLNESQVTSLIGIEDLVQVFRNLKKLTITSHSLRGANDNETQNKEILCVAIQQAKNIEELSLQFYDQNKIIESSSFFQIINNKQNLKSLILGCKLDQQLTEGGLVQLFNDISQNKELTHLTIGFRYDRKFSNVVMQALGNCVSKLTVLNRFILQIKDTDSYVDYEGFLSLLQGISALSSLVSVYLGIKVEVIKFDTLKQLFISISNQKNLKILHLSITGENCLSESEFEQLESYIQFPSSIQSLYFTVPLKARFSNLENLFIQSSKLKYLTRLWFSLGSLEMTNEDIMRFSSYLTNLRLLSVLNLDNDTLSLLYLHKLFESIDTLEIIHYKSEWKQLQVCRLKAERIYLKNSRFSKQTGQRIFEVKQQNSLTLQNSYLLTQKQLTDKEFDWIPFVFGNLKMLTSLDFILPKMNSLTSEAVNLIFTSFKDLQNLQELTLKIEEHNEIRNEGLSYLGNILCSLPQLKKLKLTIQSDNCGIIWSEAHGFYESIGQLQLLTSLSLTVVSPQQLQDEQFYIKYLLKNIGFLRNLAELKINLGTKNSQIKFDDLLETFSKLQDNLRYLTINLSNLSLSDEMLFLKCLNQLKNLQCLELNESKTKNAKKCLRLVKLNKIDNLF